MKRNNALAALCIMFSLLLCACSGGNADHAEYIIGDSDIYTESEIKSAMDIAVREFEREFDGCTMTEICYDEAFSLKTADLEAENHDADEAIVLFSSFDVDDSGAGAAFTPGMTYTRWKWILTRSGFGGWKLQGFGYA